MEFFSGVYFAIFGPEKTPYFDTFHIVRCPPFSIDFRDFLLHINAKTTLKYLFGL